MTLSTTLGSVQTLCIKEVIHVYWNSLACVSKGILEKLGINSSPSYEQGKEKGKVSFR